MASNIGCFIGGCHNTVIGQCAGCGQFYCYNHAAGKLCRTCGERKDLDARMKDYFEIAKKIHGQEPNVSIYITIILGFIGLVCAFMSAIGGLVFCVVLAAPFVIFIAMRTKKVKKAVADTDKIKPGFRKVYRMYEDALHAEEKALLSEAAFGMLGGALAGGAKGVGDAAKSMMEPPPDATRHDVVRAIRNLEKKL